MRNRNMALKARGGHLLRRNGHLTTCCCSFCCARDEWPVLYATLDNFEVDHPFNYPGGTVPPGPDNFGHCSFMCDNAINPDEMNTMGLTAIPSNYNNGMSFPPGWEYNGDTTPL